MLKELGVFAVGSTNAERTAEIVRAFKHSLNDKDKDISAESKQALQSDPVYIDLRNEVIKYDLYEFWCEFVTLYGLNNELTYCH
jgi:hypothetical protein